MPNIAGQKVACSPCIRGHRSTKCTHAGERVMLQVRKPGRPLSTCPHPPGKGCVCASGSRSITAAIPRKAKCACPSQESSGKSTPAKVEPLGSDDPTSNTKPLHRIQKTSISRASSRKYSFDPATLSRVDPNSFNIVGSYGALPVHPYPTVGAIDAIAPSFVPTFTHGFDQTAEPIFHNQAPFQVPVPIPDGLDRPRPFIATQLSPKMDASDVLPTESTNGTRTSSCCSGTSANSGTHSVYHTPASSSGSISHELTPPEANGSCCAPKLQAVEGQPLEAYAPPRNGSNEMQQRFPMDFNGQIFAANYQQATIYTYPATYGSSFLNPLQQWQHDMATLNYAPPTSQAGYLHAQNVPQGPAGYAAAATIHECGCGPGCNCLGCAAHPYNEATKEYVRSGVLVESDVARNGSYDPVISGQSESDSPVDEASQAQTPLSDSPSTVTGEDQSYPSEGYFYVSYGPDMLGCGGQQETCPCGESCECVGCFLHGNPPADAPVT